MANIQQEIDLELIKKKAISGIVTFTFRTLFIQAYTFVATFILTIILSPEIFGIYFVVLALINLLIYFSDVGLAAALIQKKEEPTRTDLVTTFTIQQLIVGFLVIIGLIFSGTIAKFYQLDADGILLLRVLIFSLFLSSLKTIPSVLLERHLSFTKFVIPQIAENFVFYTLAIVLAISGFGIASITYSVLARGLVGLVIIYVLSPFKPAIGFEIKSAKRLVSFGIPFQLNSVIALAKDDLLVVVLGKVLSFTQIGYIGWSQRFAFLPLRFIMDNVIKVTFPAYSRLQHDFNSLKTAIEKSLFFTTFTVYPSVIGLLAIAPRVLQTVPNYGKWEPAIPLLYFFAINALFASINTTLTNTLFAIGKPSIVLKLMVAWTSLTWVLTFILIKLFSFTGVAIASAVVAASTSVIIYYVKKEIDISIIKNIYGPVLASALMFLFLKFLDNILPVNILSLAVIVFCGVLTYFTISVLLLKNKLIESLKIVLRALSPSNG